MIRLDAVTIGAFTHVRVYSPCMFADKPSEFYNDTTGMRYRGELILPNSDWVSLNGSIQVGNDGAPEHITGIHINERP